MSSPFYQDVHQASPPPTMTPADSASSPSNFAMVTPHGRGPAPYDIQADLPDMAGPCAAAYAAGGAGVLYPMSPRIADARTMMESPQGFGSDGYDILGGYHSGGGDGWPSDVEPVHDGP